MFVVHKIRHKFAYEFFMDQFYVFVSRCGESALS